MAPDPKTKLHKRMFRQNKSPINKKIKVEAFFLWIDSIFSTIHPQETNRMIFFFNNQHRELNPKLKRRRAGPGRCWELELNRNLEPGSVDRSR